MNHPDGMNIGMRHITLSTCGITEKIEMLADENLQLTLAISLHAPEDDTRNMLVPANRGRGIASVLDACERYYEKTGRRISFEYAMIEGVNDSTEQARQLARLARRVKAHINLIPLNHVEERSLRASGQEHIRAFCEELEKNGANFTVRRSLGGDVDASCGQLRRKREQNRTEETNRITSTSTRK